MEVRFIHTLDITEVRNLCIKRQWYTRGDCQEYENMFDLCKSGKSVTADDVLAVAEDIYYHSDRKQFEGEDRKLDILSIANSLTFYCMRTAVANDMGR